MPLLDTLGQTAQSISPGFDQPHLVYPSLVVASVALEAASVESMVQHIRNNQFVFKAHDVSDKVLVPTQVLETRLNPSTTILVVQRVVLVVSRGRRESKAQLIHETQCAGHYEAY
jgi:hypothetical protein